MTKGGGSPKGIREWEGRTDKYIFAPGPVLCALPTTTFVRGVIVLSHTGRGAGRRLCVDGAFLDIPHLSSSTARMHFGNSIKLDRVPVSRRQACAKDDLE